jgi:ATP-dependent DNA helicase PIF1
MPPPLPIGQATPPTPAVSDNDWTLLSDFKRALGEEVMEFCPRCKERWFQVNLKKDCICQRCHKYDDKSTSGVLLMSAENYMDPGELPTFGICSNGYTVGIVVYRGLREDG